LRRLVRDTALALALGILLPLSPYTLAHASSRSPLDEVTEKIICSCGCNNLTVKNCTCGKADRARADILTRLARGEDPDQILRAYVGEYGEQILAAPTRSGFNLIGWIVPFVAVLTGATFLVLVLRRWARVPLAEAPLVQPLGTRPPSSPDPAFLKRVEEEMDESES